MKENDMVGGVGVTAFDLPNNQHPGYENHIHYGNIPVPHPTNEAAKKVDHAKVMRQVNEAK